MHSKKSYGFVFTLIKWGSPRLGALTEVVMEVASHSEEQLL